MSKESVSFFVSMYLQLLCLRSLLTLISVKLTYLLAFEACHYNTSLSLLVIADVYI